ncbi:hypothetical protein Btru_020981 [Bulinus truncatus]|nr:hypothetical protein Btru_020981 [Bulinus truncatus]
MWYGIVPKINKGKKYTSFFSVLYLSTRFCTMDLADSNCVQLLSSFELFKSHSILQNELHSISLLYQNTNIVFKDQALVVLVQPFFQLLIYLRFQLQPDYPDVSPEISVSSDCLTKTQTDNIEKLMTEKAKGSVGQPMLLNIVQEACSHLVKRNEMVASIINAEGHNSQQSLHRDKPKKVHQKMSKLCHENEQQKRKAKKYQLFTGCAKVETEFIKDMPTNNLDLCNISDLAVKRPTHFIALRITDERIVQNLVKIQNQLIRKEPLLTKGLFTKDIFHVTICSLGLDRSDDITKCIQSLDQMKPDLLRCLPQAALVVHSMSQFYNRAIYAKVRHSDDFTRFCNLLRDKLIASGIEIRDEHENFTPHVTIVKVKRPERKLFGNRNIEPSLYSHVLSTVFGEQAVNGLFLCSMDGQRRPDGFYVTLHEIIFR